MGLPRWLVAPAKFSYTHQKQQITIKMEKTQPKLKKYKFSTWDIYGKNRETFILFFYSKKEAIEFAKEWQAQNPLKNIQIYLGY